MRSMFIAGPLPAPVPPLRSVFIVDLLGYRCTRLRLRSTPSFLWLLPHQPHLTAGSLDEGVTVYRVCRRTTNLHCLLVPPILRRLSTAGRWTREAGKRTV